MEAHACQDCLLVFVTQSGQRIRQRGADAPRVDGKSGLGREPSREGEASHHPVVPSSKQLRDRLFPELVVKAQRGHDSRLVQDRQSPGRRVGGQQRGLGVAQARQALDHHGDVRGPRAEPALQALEAVEDLVGPVLAHPDAQGELGEPTSATPYATLPQDSEARPESSDRDPQHLGGGRERLRVVVGADRPRCALFECVCHWNLVWVLRSLASQVRREVTDSSREARHEFVRQGWRFAPRQAEHLPVAVRCARAEGAIGHEVQVFQALQRPVDLRVAQAEFATDPLAAVVAHAAAVRRQAEEGVGRHGLAVQEAQPALSVESRCGPAEGLALQPSQPIRPRDHCWRPRAAAASVSLVHERLRVFDAAEG